MAADITLIPFSHEHIQLTFSWIQDPALRRMFLMRGDASWEGHREYFAKVLADPAQRIYAILADGRHIGNCGYKHLDIKTLEGELWIYIGETSLRQKGVGKIATELLIQEGFKSLGLTLIYIHVADFNIAARALYRQMGFTEVPVRERESEWENRGCTIIRMEWRRD